MELLGVFPGKFENGLPWGIVNHSVGSHIAGDDCMGFSITF